MKSIGIATVVLALLAGLAGDASAQTRRGTFTLSTGNEGRKVVIQDPPPAHAQPVYPLYPAFPVAYTLLPAIVMSDGSVFANFGYGYLQVSRPCAVSTPRVLDGRGFQTTQPAPAEPTASEQNLPSVQAQRRAAERAAHGACYGQDRYGRIVVIR